MSPDFVLPPLTADTILSIDPGNTQSGWVVCRHDTSVLGHLSLDGFGIADNEALRKAIRKQWSETADRHLLIETPRPTGIPVAAEVMETLIEIGRILQLWRGEWTYCFRQEVKLHITGMPSSKDANVNQALRDRFGGDSVAVGGKKCLKCKGKRCVGRDKAVCDACSGSGWLFPPGPLHGCTSHALAALALPCWWVDSGKPIRHLIAGRQPVAKKR